MLILTLLLSALAFPAAAEDGVKVVVNGSELSFDVPPQIIDGRTMVPMRIIFEALGALVGWDGETSTITAEREGLIIVMRIDDTKMSVDGTELSLDVPPLLIDGRTLVPVRAVAEGFKAGVSWDGATQTVTITADAESASPAAPADPAPADPAAAPPAPPPPPAPVPSPGNHSAFGSLYGYGDDLGSEIRYWARHEFEQYALPYMIYENAYEVIDQINASQLFMLKHMIGLTWEFTARHSLEEYFEFVINYVLQEMGEDYFDELIEEHANDDIYDEYEQMMMYLEYVEEKVVDFGLSDSNIAAVTIEKIDEQTKAVVIKMADTGWRLLSTYIGIAYNDSVGLCYFTLEKSFDFGGENQYMFCYVDPDSRGSITLTKNDKTSFINEIRNAMSK